MGFFSFLLVHLFPPFFFFFFSSSLLYLAIGVRCSLELYALIVNKLYTIRVRGQSLARDNIVSAQYSIIHNTAPWVNLPEVKLDSAANVDLKVPPLTTECCGMTLNIRSGA